MLGSPSSVTWIKSHDFICILQSFYNCCHKICGFLKKSRNIFDQKIDINDFYQGLTIVFWNLYPQTCIFGIHICKIYSHQKYRILYTYMALHKSARHKEFNTIWVESFEAYKLHVYCGMPFIHESNPQLSLTLCLLGSFLCTASSNLACDGSNL